MFGKVYKVMKFVIMQSSSASRPFLLGPQS